MTYNNDIGPLSAAVMRQLQGRVPYDVLVDFIAEWVEHDDPAKIGPILARKMVDRIYVYALEPINGDTLVVLPLGVAGDEALNQEGAAAARTFGELRENAPDGGNWIDELEIRAEYPTFEHYLFTLDIDYENEDARKAAQKEYDEFSPYGWRPPRDDDPFDLGDWNQYCFDYGSPGGAAGYFNPPVAMYDVLPTSVLAHFAKLDAGAFGDTFVTLDPADEAAIVAHFEELGYLLVKDKMLIGGCYGEGYTVAELTARIAWYDQLEKLRTELADTGRELRE